MSKENINLFENAGRLFFRRDQIKNFESQINIAGINMPADSFAGYLAINVMILTFVLSLVLFFYPPSNQFIMSFFKGSIEIPSPIIFVLLLVPSFVLVYVSTNLLVSTYVLMKADDRRNKLETALPDFLALVASNIKAGMTLDQSMWYSAKPEFGLLSTEIKSIIKSAFSGQSLEDALVKLGSRFDSKIFKRTLLLLKQSASTGGELTKVLEKTADDVRNTLIMKKEISASLVLYEIFVLFAAAIGTPFLFAVASKLIFVFEKLGPQLSGSSGSAGSLLPGLSGVKIAANLISSSDFFWFSIPTMFITSLISAFIISVIKTGSKNQGVKYFPFILMVSYFVFWIASQFIQSFFSSIA